MTIRRINPDFAKQNPPKGLNQTRLRRVGSGLIPIFCPAFGGAKFGIKAGLFALPLFINNFVFADQEAYWEKAGQGIYENNTISILSMAVNDSTLLAATEKSLYSKESKQKSFKEIFKTQTSAEHIQGLYADDQGVIYITTSNGLYKKQTHESNWKKEFSPFNAKERNCFWFLENKDTQLLATEGGLLLKDKNAARWQKAAAPLSSKAIYQIARDENYFYFISDDQVFRSNDELGGIREVFSLLSKEKNLDQESIGIIENGAPLKRQLRFISVLNAQKIIYLVTSRGILKSHDHGETWQSLPMDGLSTDEIISLLVIDDRNIYAGTMKGVFYFQDGHWESIYQGMDGRQVNFLTKDLLGNVFAATDKGIYQLWHKKQDVEIKPHTLKKQNDFHDPSIRQVYQMAIAYAEVSPRKISDWRRAAKNKAWLPTLSVRLDRATTDLFHWDTGANPDALLKGREHFDWDVSLSWNMGELIWNNDQTSIDSRSKLMVELRGDVLDQVTRIYFERRRLQSELGAPADTLSQQYRDNQMRIEELTALLDGFTGGEFSKN